MDTPPRIPCPPRSSPRSARASPRSPPTGRCSTTPAAAFRSAGVIDASASYMARYAVQLGASYELSARATERVAAGHRAAERLVGAAPGEVVLGASTTANLRLLARALRPLFAPGDEVVVTDLDHESNIGPWRALAEDGVVRARVALPARDRRAGRRGPRPLLTPRTRLVCFTHCSNVVGTIHDAAAIIRRVHEAGALACVDGVAFAPHRRVDVKALDADFYAVSLYKVYGPHLGLLYGRARTAAPRAFAEPLLLRRGRGPLQARARRRPARAGRVAARDPRPPARGRGGPARRCRGPRRRRARAPGTRVRRDRAPRGRARRAAARVPARAARRAPGGRADGRSGAPRADRGVQRRRPRRRGDPGARSTPRASRSATATSTRTARSRRWACSSAGGIVRVSMVHYNTPDEVGRLIDALDAAL